MTPTKKLHQLFNKLFQRYAREKLVDSFFKPSEGQSATRTPPEFSLLWKGDESEEETRATLARGYAVTSQQGTYQALADITGMVRRITLATIVDSRETSVKDFDNIDQYIDSLKVSIMEAYGIPYGASRNAL